MVECPKKTQRSCPVCKNRNAVLLHSLLFTLPAEHPLPESVDVVLCNRCGMVFHDSLATDESYTAYYANAGKYAGGTMAGAGGYTELELRRFRSRMDFLSPHLQRHSQIVDVGCGQGGLLSSFKANGFGQTFGVEPSAECVKILQEKGLHGAIGSFTALPEFPPADLMVVSHVFEHLNQLREAMETIKRVLNPNGLLYLETPDAAEYLNYFHKPYYYFDLEHINHFSLKLLSLLADLNGFRVVSTFQGADEVQPDFFKPSIGVLLKRKKSAGGEGLIVDDQLGQAMKDYIARSAEQDQYPAINGLIESGTPFYIWGIGAFVGRLLAEGRFTGANVKGLIDIDPTKQGLVYGGYPVFPPEILGSCSENPDVLLAAVQYEQSIRTQLIEFGFNGKIHVLHAEPT